MALKNIMYQILRGTKFTLDYAKEKNKPIKIIQDMKEKIITAFALVCIMFLAYGCKDPREKTIWDFIDGKSANEEQYRRGIEQ